MAVWVLGDQLTHTHGPLAARPDEPVLMVEARSFAVRRPYHPHKLTLVFSAMRHFRDELREAGREVAYYETGTFREGVERFLEEHPYETLVAMEPASHGAGDRLRELVTECGGDLDLVENELFLCPVARFEEWVEGRSTPYRQEQFYRMMRRETGYLMDGSEPVGGEWNYDEENRAFPGSDYDPPAPLRFEPDGTTMEVSDWVRETFDGSYDSPPYGGAWADPEAFSWPVTRTEALEALEGFCSYRLAAFGPYQDAMVRGEWAMNHALLGAAMNLGLLHPVEVIERVLESAEADTDVPLSSVEGFVRQVLGWREFLRHVYRVEMPGLATANQLDATEDLPGAYWTGETDMACLSEVVDGVRTRGYSHHIERLMVLSNFALCYGVEPRQLNDWFHAAYVDAYHWVTTPNVVEMGSYGSGVFATKPYAASANYIDRMSDHCSNCAYYKTKATGEGACPFNTLYWEFLGRNEETLRSSGRMGLVYSHWDRKDEDEREAIRERAMEVRELAERGEL
jgi:deoxyribodipyrimidine photolyase-related protein